MRPTQHSDRRHAGFVRPQTRAQGARAGTAAQCDTSGGGVDEREARRSLRGGGLFSCAGVDHQGTTPADQADLNNTASHDCPTDGEGAVAWIGVAFCIAVFYAAAVWLPW